MKRQVVPYIIIGILVLYIFVDFFEVTKEAKETSEFTESNQVEEIYVNQEIDSPLESVEIQYATDFKLTSLDGKTIKLSELKGKKVILNFWATWCPPCMEEMPHLQSFYEQNKDSNIDILAVNLTNLDDGEEVVRSFVTDYGLTFPVLLDTEGIVGMTYEIFTIPTSFILDEEGRIFQKVVGPMDEQMMNDMINAIPN